MTAPYYVDDLVTLHHGDCVDVLRALPDASVDAVVTDPPYALEFMGKGWDKFTPLEFEEWVSQWAVECLRVLKPGGHLLAFGGSRTWHRLAAGIEDAGFEIRDSIAWLAESVNITDPATDAAREWEGWGTALKPAFEPIVVARKPLAGTVAANVLAHGTGALNIDATRIEAHDSQLAEKYASAQNAGSRSNSVYGADTRDRLGAEPHAGGRWPSNVVMDESQAAELDRVGGDRPPSPSRTPVMRNRTTESGNIYANGRGIPNANQPVYGYADAGGASRFFPVFASTPSELPQVGDVLRSMGQPTTVIAVERKHDETWGVLCEQASGQREEFLVDVSRPLPTFRYEAKAPTSERPKAGEVQHPTVKPLDLMRWLVRLVTPPNGVVLEPFAGSGTTVEACLREGFRCIAIEREADYLPLIMQRVKKDHPQSLFGDWDGAA